jgi:hypothetical protein
MPCILEEILTSCDDLISERLRRTKIYPSKARKGLGRHISKGDSKGRFCRGRKIRKRGYRKEPRRISTVFGMLDLRIKVAECFKCGVRYSPLLSSLQIDSPSRKEMNFEHEVIESVIDTNYRRLIDGRAIDIFLGGIHNIVAGRVKPLECFTNTTWHEIEGIIKKRIEESGSHNISFVYDGEPGLDDFPANVAETQRCTWHGPRGLYHALWEDGLKKKRAGRKQIKSSS